MTLGDRSLIDRSTTEMFSEYSNHIEPREIIVIAFADVVVVFAAVVVVVELYSGPVVCRWNLGGVLCDNFLVQYCTSTVTYCAVSLSSRHLQLASQL